MGESLIMHFCVRYGRKDSIVLREGKLSEPLFIFGKEKKTLDLFKKGFIKNVF